MGMRVLATRRHLPTSTDPLGQQFFSPEARQEMIALCDYVVATAPLTEETRRMISDRNRIHEAERGGDQRGTWTGDRPGGFAARPPSRKNQRSRLGCVENEPLPTGDPLYTLENVLLSPHCADHTADWQDKAMRFFLEQYCRFEKGEPLNNIVNKRLGY